MKLNQRLVNDFLRVARLTGNVDTARKLIGIDPKTWQGVQLAVEAGRGSRLERRLVSELQECRP